MVAMGAARMGRYVRTSKQVECEQRNAWSASDYGRLLCGAAALYLLGSASHARASAQPSALCILEPTAQCDTAACPHDGGRVACFGSSQPAQWCGSWCRSPRECRGRHGRRPVSTGTGNWYCPCADEAPCGGSLGCAARPGKFIPRQCAARQGSGSAPSHPAPESLTFYSPIIAAIHADRWFAHA